MASTTTRASRSWRASTATPDDPDGQRGTEHPGRGPRTTAPSLPSDNGGFAELPESACRLGAAFADANGATWAVLRDKPKRIHLRLLEPAARSGTAYGKPSGDVVAPNAELHVRAPGALSR